MRRRSPKDGINNRVVHGDSSAVRLDGSGTKAAFWYYYDAVAPGDTVAVRLRLSRSRAGRRHVRRELRRDPRGSTDEADEFYQSVHYRTGCPRKSGSSPARHLPACCGQTALSVQRPTMARGRSWTSRRPRRSDGPVATRPGSTWPSLTSCPCRTSGNTRGSPPGIWRSTAWRLPMSIPSSPSSNWSCSRREWCMHPNGQLPAYEWAFGDVNPPVHAWAALAGLRDRRQSRSGIPRSASAHKLLLNFTWWVNRKDADGINLFEGGFLGLDNIGFFDRSAPLPTAGIASSSPTATSWMAFFCLSAAAHIGRACPARPGLG